MLVGVGVISRIVFVPSIPVNEETFNITAILTINFSTNKELLHSVLNGVVPTQKDVYPRVHLCLLKLLKFFSTFRDGEGNYWNALYNPGELLIYKQLCCTDGGARHFNSVSFIFVILSESANITHTQSPL